MKWLIFIPLSLLFGCNEKMTSVSVTEFESFVSNTGYKTDAENYGWSYVQQSVFTVDTVHHADWRKPDGVHPSKPEDPVTQVSYNDAIASCKWAGTRLPTYSEYWVNTKHDNRRINTESMAIENRDRVSIIGNVWELCASDLPNVVPLAGGSYLCSKKMCNGTSKEKKISVDPFTANRHIGFCVLDN